MAAGTPYAKRYAGGFFDGSGGGTPIDSTFLNAVEAALLQLIAQAPTADGQVMQWVNASTQYGPALLLNKNIDPAAAIASSKIDFTGGNGITDAMVKAAAAIAYSKLNLAGNVVNADINAAAAIALSKLAGMPPYAASRIVAAKIVNTSTAATDLFSGGVSTPILGTSSIVRVTAWGDWLQNIGTTQAPPRFQVIFGGTTLLDTGTSGTVTSGSTRRPWNIDFLIANQGATNVQKSRMVGFLGCVPSGTDVFNAFTTGEGIYSESNAAASYTGAWIQGKGAAGALDTTSAKTLVFNVINGNGGAAYETVLDGAIVEVIL